MLGLKLIQISERSQCSNYKYSFQFSRGAWLSQMRLDDSEYTTIIPTAFFIFIMILVLGGLWGLLQYKDRRSRYGDFNYKDTTVVRRQQIP